MIKHLEIQEDALLEESRMQRELGADRINAAAQAMREREAREYAEDIETQRSLRARDWKLERNW